MTGRKKLWRRISSLLMIFVFMVMSSNVNVIAATSLSISAKTSNTEVALGEKIVLSATAEGGSGNYTYSFLVCNKSTGKWARLTESFTNNNTFTWKAQTPGNREFFVEVKDSTGKVVRSKAILVNVTNKLSVSASTSASMVEIGGSLKLTAKATGGSGSYTYSYIVYNQKTGKWARLADNITKNTYTWKAKNCADRIFYIDVKDSTGKVVRSKALNVSVVNKLSVTANSDDTEGLIGQSIKLTANATGGSGVYSYSYIVFNKNTNKWFRLADNVSSKEYTWKVDNVGERVFYIDVKDSSTGKVVRSNPINIVVPDKISVTGVILSKNELNLNAGSSEQLTATVSPSIADNKAVVWSSSNTKVATVDNNGLVKAVGNGETIITVKTVEGGKTANCTVKVRTAPTGVSLNVSTLNLNSGAGAQLSATVSPGTASNKSVTWSSSNTAVAKVNGSGYVTAVGNGTATITVRTAEGGKVANCIVTVNIPYIAVTSVDITNEKSFVVDINGTTSKTLQCTYNVLPSTATNKSVTWESSDTSVATVDSKGKITAVGFGSATITVKTVDGGKTDTFMVYVYKSDAIIRGGDNWWLKMKLSKTSLYMTSANVAGTSGTKVQLGKYTGKDTQLWQFVDCLSTKGGVAFMPRGNAGSNVLTADTSSSALNVGSLINLQKLGIDDNSSIFTIVRLWNDAYILKLKGTDLAVGVNSATEGTQLTFVKFDLWNHNQRWFVEGVEKIAPTQISLNKTSVSLNPKGTVTLSTTITPSNATDKSVIWSSSNKSVATVSSSGVVTAVGNGTATITAKTVDGAKTATCTVKVTTPVTGVEITNDKSFVVDINGSASKTLQCTYNVLPSTASNKAVTWKSSNTAVATVDSKGKITALSVGSSTITITTADGAKTDTYKVYVYESESAIRGGGNWWLKMKLAKTSLYMTSANSSGTVGTKVQLGKATSTVTDTQLWQFVDCLSSNGGVAFKSRANAGSNVLTANTSSNALNTGSLINLQKLGTDYNSSIFTIIKLWNDSYILKLRGTDLAVGVKSATEGTQLTFVEFDLWDYNQRWFIEGVEKIAPTKVTLNKTSVSLNPSEKVTLSATISPTDATDKSVTWSSSNTAVATVDSNGVVTAKAEGTATITVKTKDGGKSASCEVKVVKVSTVAEKIVSLAQKEVGYKENPNTCWTKYTEWYLGTPDVPKGYEAWCAMFVSYIQNQAGDNTVSKFCSCGDGVNKYKNKGRYRTFGSYTPKAGDIVFFTQDGVGASHVGIVESVSNGKINTIEGNFLINGAYQVVRWSYDIEKGTGGITNYILGYGVTQ